VAHVGPALPAELGVAHELDAVEQRLEVTQHLRPVGQFGEREEVPAGVPASSCPTAARGRSSSKSMGGADRGGELP
jgi:hypothetical protein